jgi:glycosyltransferase involved in cell wall biosynthesis
VICIVVPAFDEEEGLRRLLPRIPARIHGHGVAVLVVSDGSSDRTAAVAAEGGAALVSFPVNRGKGAALRAGIARAQRWGFDALVTMDADGQHDPGDLERLVAPVLSGRYDLTTGTRYLEDPGRGATPLNRYLVRRSLIGVLRRRLGWAPTDPLCGYRCFSPAAVSRIRLHGDRYETELETVIQAAEAGLGVKEVPIARVYGPGTSRMGARGGPFLGRLLVILGYVATLRRTSRSRIGAPRPEGSTVVGPTRSTAGVVSEGHR